MKKIIITGASGFIGRSLVKKLSKDKKNFIVAIDNDKRGDFKKIKNKKNILKKKISVLSPNKLDKILKNCYACFHLAAINGTKNFYNIPKEVLEVGTEGTINIIKSCIKNKVKEFILFSSSEAYQKPNFIPTSEDEVLKVPDIFNPRLSYGGSKIIGELLTVNYFRNSSTKYKILRPHNVYGPDMGNDHVLPELITKIKKQKTKNKIQLEIFGSGEESRSFIYIDDAVEGICKVYRKGRKNSIYNIGTSNEIKIKDLIKLISKIIKKKIDIKKSSLHRGSVSRRCPNVTKLKKLGHKNIYSLRQGLKMTINHYYS
tara:strand:+ start:76 stop:1020 length:945 start_codon:yes stop_codon:yes gene_type:complete